MFRARMTVIALGVTLVGCGGASSTQSEASPSDVSPSVAESSEPTGTSAAIVGVWQGVHECEGIVEALTAAGFDESVVIDAVVGNGLVQPQGEIDLTTLCEEASPLEHSHEFTADGQFFSYDQDGEEVDSDTYELVDEDTLRIGGPGGTEFDFTIEGDHLTLVPQVPAGCLEFECHWAVMVAMPWSGMDRVEE
jgi:hypothetical protein